MGDFLEGLCFAVMSSIVACIIVFGALFAVEKTECSGYQRVTGKDTRFEALTCYLNNNGTWMTTDEYKSSLAGTAGEGSK
jgi:hypothetical protein